MAVEQCQLEMSEPIYLTDDLCEPCAIQNQLFLDLAFYHPEKACFPAFVFLEITGILDHSSHSLIYLMLTYQHQ